MTKINVSLPEEVLKHLDQAARESKTSRSAFLFQALQHYLDEKEEEKQRERRRLAAERIIAIAEEIGPWDATAEVLKWRDKH